MLVSLVSSCTGAQSQRHLLVVLTNRNRTHTETADRNQAVNMFFSWLTLGSETWELMGPALEPASGEYYQRNYTLPRWLKISALEAHTHLRKDRKDAARK